MSLKVINIYDSLKEAVSDNLNSDAYASELDGRAIALTDTITISKTSISNVDLGLVEANVFDLSLDKTSWIYFIVVTNSI